MLLGLRIKPKFIDRLSILLTDIFVFSNNTDYFFALKPASPNVKIACTISFPSAAICLVYLFFFFYLSIFNLYYSVSVVSFKAVYTLSFLTRVCVF